MTTSIHAVTSVISLPIRQMTALTPRQEIDCDAIMGCRIKGVTEKANQLRSLTTYSALARRDSDHFSCLTSLTAFLLNRHAGHCLALV